mmetsp:Transcript_32555/g.74383  ORF Transcript_32555/g.74383 Transcript_32555/m.74383 type:complete len:241 (+) Transcript_32555:808-1530(+)
MDRASLLHSPALPSGSTFHQLVLQKPALNVVALLSAVCPPLPEVVASLPPSRDTHASLVSPQTVHLGAPAASPAVSPVLLSACHGALALPGTMLLSHLFPAAAAPPALTLNVSSQTSGLTCWISSLISEEMKAMRGVTCTGAQPWSKSSLHHRQTAVRQHLEEATMSYALAAIHCKLALWRRESAMLPLHERHDHSFVEEGLLCRACTAACPLPLARHLEMRLEVDGQEILPSHWWVLPC